MNPFKKLTRSKTKYPLLFAHKFVIGLLLSLSFLFFFHPQPYQYIDKEIPAYINLPFLQTGDYVLEYNLNISSPDTVLSIYAPDMVDSENHVGIVIAEHPVDSGSLSGIIPFHLEKDLHSVIISTNNDSVFSSVRLQSVQLLCTDNYLMSVLCLIFAIFIALLGLYINPETYKIPFLLLSFGLLASFPMATDFLVMSQDLTFHLTRIESVYQGLHAGEFPVRIGSAQLGGFGCLSAIMYPQLFLYPAAVLRFAKVSLMLCYKLLILGLNIGCSFLSYYAAKNMSGSKKAAVLMSALYTFSIYRLVNIYCRAALGESLALTFFPLIVWGIYEILWKDEKKWYLLALGVTGIIQTHVLSFEMCLLFLIIEFIFWCFCRRHNRFLQRILAGAKAIFFSIVWNASFLIPFLYFSGEDLQCFHLSNNLSESGLYFNQMFFSFSHGDGISLPLGSINNEMSLSVGGILLIGTILFIAAVSLEKGNYSNESQIGMHCLIHAFLALLLTSWLIPWDTLYKLEFVRLLAASLQFPWRFLGIASVLLCFTAAFGIKLSEERILPGKLIYVTTALILFISTAYLFEMIARETYQSNDKMAINGSCETDSMYMYYDGKGYKDYHLGYEYNAAYITSFYLPVEYSQFTRSGSGLSVTVNSLSKTENNVLLFPIYYYPGYEVRIDGKIVDSFSHNHKLACHIPSKKADITVRYVGLPIFRVGDAISLITIMICILFIMIRRKPPES